MIAALPLLRRAARDSLVSDYVCQIQEKASR
jgi:hypothetical protein